MALRKLTADEVTFTLTVEEEPTPVRGNFMSTDNPEQDKKDEDEIINRLDCEDIYAWCWVKVTAQWKGFVGSDSLGCCTYNNEQDIKDDLYEEMCSNALADLNKMLETNYAQLQEKVP